MVSIPCWVKASTTAQRHPLSHSSDVEFQGTSNIWVNTCVGNGIMIDCCAHPQHMNIVQDPVYVGEGMWEPFHVE